MEQRDGVLAVPDLGEPRARELSLQHRHHTVSKLSIPCPLDPSK
jgi:hypothetical protein